MPYWAGRPDQTTASFAVKTHPKLSTFNGKLHTVIGTEEINEIILHKF